MFTPTVGSILSLAGAPTKTWPLKEQIFSPATPSTSGDLVSTLHVRLTLTQPRTLLDGINHFSCSILGRSGIPEQEYQTMLYGEPT